MIIKEEQLRREIRRKLLKRELESSQLNEFRMGKISGGSTTEFCDLSGIPAAFWNFSEAIRENSKEKLKKAIAKEKDAAKSGNSFFSFFKSPEEKLKDLEERSLSNRIFKDLAAHPALELLGMGAGFLASSALGLTKNDCDAIKTFVIDFLAAIAAFFGAKFDVEAARKGIDKNDNNNNIDNNKEDEDNSISVPENSFAKLFSDNLVSNDIVDSSTRRSLQDNDDVKEMNLDSFELDMFEIFANREYVKFANDVDADISTAKDKLSSLKAGIKENSDSFSSIMNIMRRNVSIKPEEDPRRATKLDQVLEALTPHLKNSFGSPSSAKDFLDDTIDDLMSKTGITNRFGF